MKNLKAPVFIIAWLLPAFFSGPAMAGNKPGAALCGADKELLVDLAGVGSGNTETYIDGLWVRYNNGYLATTSDDDEKLGKSGENLSSFREGKDLSEERRPLFQATDTVFLHITNTSISSYRFKIHMVNFSVTGLAARLEDNYLHTVRNLDTYGSTDNIDFEVTADPASADPFRFRIVFITARTLPVTITGFTALAQSKNIALQWKVSNQLNILQYEVERSADGIHFKSQAILAATATGSSQTYNWLDEHAITGDNFYRIRCTGIAGDISFSSVINVKFGKPASDISIYPNPVINATVALQFTDMEKGYYQFRLINSGGQTVFTHQQLHNGVNGNISIRFGQHIVAGNYILEIGGPDNVKITKMLRVGE